MTRATLYIHIPFCRSKCAYCDFYSGAFRADSLTYQRFVNALLREWQLRKAELPVLPETIYLGGGTPSLLLVGELHRLLEGLAHDIDFSRLREVTIEANPEDVTPAWLAEIKGLGINRVSIGVQSFEPRELQVVERMHSPEEARRALEVLSGEGWNYSADLIYGLPGQTMLTWERNLRQLLEFRPPHLSAYLLSYEPGTRLYARMVAGKIKETDESTATEMYRLLCGSTAAAGYRHYEISNFALEGRRAIHNSAYWTNTPYLGLGPGAHSLDKSGIRRFNPPKLREYISSFSTAGCGDDVHEVAPRNSYGIFARVDEETPENRFNDLVITSMRTDSGLSKDTIPSEFLPEFSANLRPLLRRGAVVDNGTAYIIPSSLWLTADSILRDLIL